MPKKRRIPWLWILAGGGVAGLAALLRRQTGFVVGAVPNGIAGAVPRPSEPDRGWKVSAVQDEAPKPDVVVEIPEEEFLPDATPEEPEPRLADPDAWLRLDPTVRGLYQVQKGDRFQGKGSRSIVYQALLRYAKALARETGRSDAWAREIAGSPQARLRYLDLLQCGGWNDATAGTYGYGKGVRPNPAGRAIRLVPQHADQMARFRAQKPALRLIQLRTPDDQGRGNAYAVDPALKETFELLWFPGLDAEAFLAGNVVCSRETWRDGTSLLWPPPEIVGLGIEVLEDRAAGEYGCIVDGCDGRMVIE